VKSASLSCSRIYLLSLRSQQVFPIPCSISASYYLEKLLFDLGANINLICYSVYKRLGMQDHRPTFVSLQLVNEPLLVP
jgi:hypothetical protein